MSTTFIKCNSAFIKCNSFAAFHNKPSRNSCFLFDMFFHEWSLKWSLQDVLCSPSCPFSPHDHVCTYSQRQKMMSLDEQHLSQSDLHKYPSSYPFLASSKCLFLFVSFSRYFKVLLPLAPRAAFSPPASFSWESLPCTWKQSLCSSKHLEDMAVSLVALNRLLWSGIFVWRGVQYDRDL